MSESPKMEDQTAFPLDKQFLDEQIQELLKSLKPPDVRHDPFYFHQQISRSEVLKENLKFSLSYYHNGKTLKYFDSFEFIIYTANLDSLQSQTVSRMLDPEARIFPETFYSMPKSEQLQQVQMRVGKYCLAEKENHNRLKEKAKAYPKKLFAIIADEAHWGITRKIHVEESIVKKSKDQETGQGDVINGGNEPTQMEVRKQAGDQNAPSTCTKDPAEDDIKSEDMRQANDLLINEWNAKEFPNVIVVQVSATPWNLLTTATRISDQKVAKHNKEILALKDLDERSAYQGCAKSITEVEKDWTKVKKEDLGAARSLHRIEWSDGMHEMLSSGIRTYIQIPEKTGGIKWLTVQDEPLDKLDLRTSQNNTGKRIVIQMGKKTETVQLKVSVGDKIYVLAAFENNKVAFLPEAEISKHQRRYHPDFHLVATYGEDIFELFNTGNKRFLCHHEDGEDQFKLERTFRDLEKTGVFQSAPIESTFMLYSYQGCVII